MTEPQTTTIKVGALARVEGEGALHVRVRSGEVEDVRLEIFEPPRFFEALLRGRRFDEVADITSRICGICPIAYQLSACAAIEDALGIEVDEPVRLLRRLIYCGEWLESHALHVFMLHAPDFLGYPGAIEMANDGHGELVERGLAIKQAGNQLIAAIGGRSVHPVNPRVGGFHRAPTAAELAPVAQRLARAREHLIETVRWAGELDYPERTLGTELAALRSEAGEASTRSRGAGWSPPRGSRSPRPSSPSTWSRSRSPTRPRCTRGLSAAAITCSGRSPATRSTVTVSRRWRSTPRESAGLESGCRNPFKSLLVRSVEMLYAADEALQIIAAYEPPEPPAATAEPAAGDGCGWTEAPRGMLWHRYRLEPDGRIAKATIVPPTSQNLASIENDVREYVQENLELLDDDLQWRCEQAVRNYDPCISCSTHFLRLELDRR